jgi:hypothetical protein
LRGEARLLRLNSASDDDGVRTEIQVRRWSSVVVTALLTLLRRLEGVTDGRWDGGD